MEDKISIKEMDTGKEKVIVVDDDSNKKEALKKIVEKAKAENKSEIFKDPNFLPSVMIDKETKKFVHITYKRNAPKVGRNEPCPCKSGKKYKNCHGK